MLQFPKHCGMKGYVDGQNKKILLCDKSDVEYHTYCLRPPVASVRQGSWLCHCCGADKNIDRDYPSTKRSVGQKQIKETEERFHNLHVCSSLKVDMSTLHNFKHD
ncbi:hypothetical protein ACP275_09G037000 [Erythranthe tilingii]